MPLRTADPPRWTWWVLIVTLSTGLLAMVAGCSGSRMAEVRIPAQAPTVNLEAPDTIGYSEVPPLRLNGAITMPGTTFVYRDLPSGPLIRAREFVVDRTPPGQSVSVQYVTGGRTIGQEYRFPAWGETLTIYPDTREAAVSGRRRPDTASADTVTVTDTVAVGEISGAPEDRQVTGECPECPEGWWGLKNEFATLGAILVGGGLVLLILGIIRRFAFPFSL